MASTRPAQAVALRGAHRRQEFGHDEVGDLVVDRRPEEDDPVLEQARVDVEGALSARVLLDHHWDHGHRFLSSWIVPSASDSGRGS